MLRGAEGVRRLGHWDHMALQVSITVIQAVLMSLGICLTC